MAALTIGVHGLAAAEAGLVRALISLAASERPRWSFVQSGRCDVLLADAAGSGLAEARSERGAHAVVLLGGAAVDGTPRLGRPLRSDQLDACLKALARQIMGRSPAEDAPSEHVAGAKTEPAKARFRLRRWPPAELLRSQPQRLRIASQLSRRFLSASELARLTGCDAEQVHTFLRLLQGFALLEPEPASADQGERSPAQPPDSRGGLVQSIRRRLGL